MTYKRDCEECGESFRVYVTASGPLTPKEHCPDCEEKVYRIRGIEALESIAASLRVIADIAPEPIPEIPVKASGGW